MRLTYYGYNAFVIEADRTVIVDPGQDLHWRRLCPLVPRAVWPRADLILVTHGDADHAEYVPHAARTSGAPVVCGAALAGRWRREGITVVPVAPGETVQAAGVPVLEQKPLARSLFKSVEVGETIPATLYKAVAEVLAYVYRLKGRQHV